jgi:23S rRNA pseudouridine2605 synthase
VRRLLERLQKIIAHAGITSRRKAEELILQGQVEVNGKVVRTLGAKADPEKDHIKLDGRLLQFRQPKVYLMLNKPRGYVSTLKDPQGRPIVMELLRGVRQRVYPVGRLDFDAEGLLLFTNDGQLAEHLMHPRYEVTRTYLVKVKGCLSDQEIRGLEGGVRLSDGMTAPCRIKKVRKTTENSWIELTMHEGRNRQVKRMLEHAGHPVLKIKRIRFAGLELADLEGGEYRYLTGRELEKLKKSGRFTTRSSMQTPPAAVQRRSYAGSKR